MAIADCNTNESKQDWLQPSLFDDEAHNAPIDLIGPSTSHGAEKEETEVDNEDEEADDEDVEHKDAQKFEENIDDGPQEDVRRPTSCLCIPNDSLADIDFFPMFTDDLISLNGIMDIDDMEMEMEMNYDGEYYGGTSPGGCSSDSPIMTSDQIVLSGNKRRIVCAESKRQRKSRRPNKSGWILNSPGSLCGYAPQREEQRIERKCTHCGTEQTPQWRVGPMGPKTLCNACGVRYKSGRLVPEYRPVAAPSFDERLHSNSHRKIMKMKTGDLENPIIVKDELKENPFPEYRPLAPPSLNEPVHSICPRKIVKMTTVDGATSIMVKDELTEIPVLGYRPVLAPISDNRFHSNGQNSMKMKTIEEETSDEFKSSTSTDCPLHRASQGDIKKVKIGWKFIDGGCEGFWVPKVMHFIC